MGAMVHAAEREYAEVTRAGRSRAGLTKRRVPAGHAVPRQTTWTGDTERTSSATMIGTFYTAMLHTQNAPSTSIIKQILRNCMALLISVSALYRTQNSLHVRAIFSSLADVHSAGKRVSTGTDTSKKSRGFFFWPKF